MNFTVKFIGMKTVMITFESGEKFFYSLDKMDVPSMVKEALEEYLEL